MLAHHSHKATQARELQTLDHGTLYVVATPIGNRDDLAPRARQILSEVALIAAEDTRHTGRLLSHFGIKTALLALHDHNEEQQVPGLIERLLAGESVALVSDAGTPLISDPGYRLVVAAHTAGVRVSPVPGPSSILAALSVAGLPSSTFAFEGFLPARTQARRARLTELRNEPRTLVFLESVHKIKATLPDMIDLLGGERPAFIGRELTKMHEQCVRGTLDELGGGIADGSITSKGEFVLIVHGQDAEPQEEQGVSSAALLRALSDELPGKKAVDIVARLTGRRRNEVYREMLAIRESASDDE